MLDINNILWGFVLILIILSGLYFTWRLPLIQFRFKEIFWSLKKEKNVKKGISPYETLMVALAGKIGVGTLAGVSLAIYTGGIGTIFWMIVASFLTAPLAFGESVLSIIYQKKDKKEKRGGPFYYMKKGLGWNNLSKIYALLIIISYIGGFIVIQVNTITKSLTTNNEIALLVGIIISFFTCFVVMRGTSRFADICSKIVPFMTIFYLSFCLWVILSNFNLLPNLLWQIIKEAFNIKAVKGGLFYCLIIGFQRSIFASEAGLGTGAIASGATNNQNAYHQGMIQMLGVYVTTLIVGFFTALIIITSDYQSLNLIDVNGIEITNYAFSFHYGIMGEWIVTISIILFAFSTIIGGYYYGIVSLKFLTKKPKMTIIVKLLTLISIIYGSVASSSFLWRIVDIMVAILSTINIYAMIKLRKDIILEWRVNKLFDKVR